MKENRFLGLMLLCVTSVFAQVKGKVIDENNQPIPYVNIWVIGEEIGTSSDENGNFNLNTTSDKELIFTSVSYESFKGKIKENEIIVLVERIIKIEEISIEAQKRKEIIIDKFTKKDSKAGFACGKKPSIIAKYFSLTDEIKKHSFLKEITFESKAEKNDVQMILHIYKANDDGTPGEEILEKNYLIDIKKGNKINIINIEKLGIIFPGNGLFIGFEWLIIEKNKIEYNYTLVEEKGKTKHKDGIKYDPTIKAIPSIEGNTWRFSKGTWNKPILISSNEMLKQFEGKYFELALSLKLTN